MSPSQMAQMMRLLAQSATVPELMAAAGLSRPTVNKALAGLHEQHLARIVTWRRLPNNRAEPVWTLGAGPHEERPVFSAAEKQRLYRQRRLRVVQSMVQAITRTTSGAK